MSPRVAVVARESKALGCAISPCCFKGSLGKRVRQRATALSGDASSTRSDASSLLGDAYSILARVMLLLCEADDPDATVELRRDPEMGSPKDAFVVVRKQRLLS